MTNKTTTKRNADMTGIEQYNAAARASSAMVIGAYSTSFGLAAKLLAPRIREQIRTIYALVRIADEIVDGAAAGAGLDDFEQRELLDDLENETRAAIRRGYSTNLVVHAFALTANETGIDDSLTTPFFASMRRDLDPSPFTRDDVAEYIYGSAEVIGLMCLRAFEVGESRSLDESERLEAGARALGSAFQKINFLRDLAADSEALGRNYFPGVDPSCMTEVEKDTILDDIEADLGVAAAVLPLLPGGCRSAVTAAHHLFALLAKRLRATSATDLLATRVRVPDAQKLLLAISVSVSAGTEARKR
ncbi:phytoene/squalene synthase family protein [Leifsonia sp. A12D58]|uniref:phytoene/squalene synthase family protein n=1 Tax=Leifsonia sp. A12D58 TaxID=3397674 RepID=UPI0039E099ED